jgi:uncharacterized iron-regulated membrane protein
MNSDQELEQSTSGRKGLYATIWRWHFYAGLYVAPFLFMLTITGMVMLFSPQIETLLYSDKLFVNPSGAALSAEAQIQAVQQQYPGRRIQNYRPGAAPDRSSEVTVGTEAAAYSAFVNPYTGQVLGDVPVSRRPMSFAQSIHATLLVGTFGDRLIEIAAGFGIVLVISGIYLWWPRETGLLQSLQIRGEGRLFWRNLHTTIGAVIAVGLLFYLISGLTWTGIWGERYVQAWSTFPVSEVTGPHHASLNAEGGPKEVPWALEQTPMPESHAHGADASGARITIDRAIRIAQAQGIGTQYVVSVPQDENGVWTIAATTMNKAARDPRQELTVHVDQYTGAVRQKIGWQDYGVGARAMAVSVPLHQGNFGGWNTALSAFFCLALVLLAFSGARMWWLRRPAMAFHLGAPRRAANTRVPAVVVATMTGIGIAFPLTGIVMVAVLILDFLLIQRTPWLRKAFG